MKYKLILTLFILSGCSEATSQDGSLIECETYQSLNVSDIHVCPVADKRCFIYDDGGIWCQ